MRVMIVPRWDSVNQIPLRYRGFLGVGGGVGDSGSEPELNKINDLKRKRADVMPTLYRPADPTPYASWPRWWFPSSPTFAWRSAGSMVFAGQTWQ